MRRIWALARFDFLVWVRTPWAVAAAVIPPAGMALLVAILTWSVTKQPVAVVVQGTGPQAKVMAGIIESDHEAYMFHEPLDKGRSFITNLATAQRLLADQQVAAVIVIPADFDQALARGRASVDLTLNNVDYDYSDDIRRAMDRSVAEYDAPQLGASLEKTATSSGLVVPNPYRVDIDETDLRQTNVSFFKYQTVPVLILLIVNVGVLGGALLGARDHERRTMKFLRLSPLGRPSLIIGRLLGTTLAILVVLVPAVAAATLDHVIKPPPSHWPALIAILGATTLLAAGLGVMLGAAFRRSSTVAVAAVIVSSYLFFLGGGFTQVAFLPQWLIDVSRAVPTRYAIDAMRQALFYPNLQGFRGDLTALLLFTAGCVAGGIVALHRTAQ
jgi:ABC-2 type transport system permease protein